MIDTKLRKKSGAKGLLDTCNRVECEQKAQFIRIVRPPPSFKLQPPPDPTLYLHQNDYFQFNQLKNSRDKCGFIRDLFHNDTKTLDNHKVLLSISQWPTSTSSLAVTSFNSSSILNVFLVCSMAFIVVLSLFIFLYLYFTR